MSIDAFQGPSFSLSPLRKAMLENDPFKQFASWYKEAEQACKYANPVSLATANSDGQPVVRTVLLKGYDQSGFRFYTNYASRKARQLLSNPKASMCFYWEALERQVIVLGSVEKLSAEDSDQYFATRGRGSQIGAHVSSQSQVIEHREILEKQAQQLESLYQGKSVPRPENWGGYCLVPTSIEFWQGQPDRLHDRFIYERSNQNWSISRLAP